MYLVAITTTDLIAGTTYVYLHHADRRMQLSHCIDSEVVLPTLDDARHALDLVADFYDWDTDVTARYITITGPDGPVQDSYRGPNDDHYRLPLIAKHNAALAGYRIDPVVRPGLDAALAQFGYATMYRDAR